MTINGSQDGPIRGDKPSRHLSNAKVPRGQAEKMAAVQRTDLGCAIADPLVFCKEDPASGAALVDPDFVLDVLGVVPVKLGDPMHDPSVLAQPFRASLPQVAVEEDFRPPVGAHSL